VSSLQKAGPGSIALLRTTPVHLTRKTNKNQKSTGGFTFNFLLGKHPAKKHDKFI
jgi:hypothetical protein